MSFCPAGCVRCHQLSIMSPYSRLFGTGRNARWSFKSASAGTYLDRKRLANGVAYLRGQWHLPHEATDLSFNVGISARGAG